MLWIRSIRRSISRARCFGSARSQWSPYTSIRSAVGQVTVSDAAERMVVRRRLAARREPIGPAAVLRMARGHDLAPVLCVRERVERFPTLIDEHAQRQQRRAPNPVLAVDQHLVAAADMATREGNATIELVGGRRLEVGRRQVKEVDSGVAQAL